MFEDIIIHTYKLLLWGIGIPLLVLFALGLITAILQAITQIQDQIISFLPKIVLLSITLYLFFGIYFESLVELLKIALEST